MPNITLSQMSGSNNAVVDVTAGPYLNYKSYQKTYTISCGGVTRNLAVTLPGHPLLSEFNRLRGIANASGGEYFEHPDISGLFTGVIMEVTSPTDTPLRLRCANNANIIPLGPSPDINIYGTPLTDDLHVKLTCRYQPVTVDKLSFLTYIDAGKMLALTTTKNASDSAIKHRLVKNGSLIKEVTSSYAQFEIHVRIPVNEKRWLISIYVGGSTQAAIEYILPKEDPPHYSDLFNLFLMQFTFATDIFGYAIELEPY